ncbi:hypothetical protein L1049_009225 [Liquidambar formosana]|uniref:Uncharacterized protein n=1 Tax=Liquidambar formosana TaxID=63359 RepID=A0AAP0X516_LIQFO
MLVRQKFGFLNICRCLTLHTVTTIQTYMWLQLFPVQGVPCAALPLEFQLLSAPFRGPSKQVKSEAINTQEPEDKRNTHQFLHLFK